MKKSNGFFTNDIVSNVVRGDEKINVKSKNNLMVKATCSKCELKNGCKHPKMQPTGKGKLQVLIVGEAPGKMEDEKGIQFVGDSGKLLRNILHELGMNLDRDFWKTNAVCCRPPKNAEPTNIQIMACRKNLMDAIEKYKPKVIIPMGKIAMDAVMGMRSKGRLSGVTMTDWAGCQIPDQDLKLWICPTWHPSYILRSEDRKGNVDPVLKMQITNHLKMAVRLAEVPFYEATYDSECFCVDNVDEAIKIIKDMSKKQLIAIDYETTGKKPHRNGHKILYASISDGMFAYSFPFFNDAKFRKTWWALMVNESVGKIMHNVKFENTWNRFRSGPDDSDGPWIEKIYWDTMLAAHELNNRKRTGLKFQTYIHFGVAGYDDEIDGFIQAIPKEEELYGANAFNNMSKAPPMKAMKYNAMDSFFTFKLYEWQRNRLSPEQLNGRLLFIDGVEAFAKAEDNGIRCNIKKAEKKKNEITEKMELLESKISKYPELKKWDMSKPFRPSAASDITHLLFGLLKYKCKDEDCTETGRPKADYETLEKYDLPIVKDVLEWRKLQKIRDTYLKGFIKETVNGRLRPSFNLHLVDTFRSSSDSPNFQNIPKHDENTASLLRELLKPRKGHKLGEYDYKAIEVCILACYNKDPSLIKYINNPKSDMHRDQAAELFLKDAKQITSKERYGAKNGFVFPTFYGSWYKNTANNLWMDASDETIKHLKKQGIKTLDDFTDHVQTVEKRFWENKFPVAREWMDKTLADYKQKGFIDLYTGFRCWGPMSVNQVINYRIQGSAFHCLLWTFVNVQKELEDKNMDALLIGQIHDAMIPDFNEDEESLLDSIIWNYGTQKIREHWPWIIVPLNIEKSSSDIDGTWAKMNECGLLKGGME